MMMNLITLAIPIIQLWARKCYSNRELVGLRPKLVPWKRLPSLHCSVKLYAGLLGMAALFRAIDASTDSIVLDSFIIVAASLILNQMIDYNWVTIT